MPGNRTTGKGCKIAIARRGFYPRRRGGSMRRRRIGWRVSGFEGGEELGRTTVRGWDGRLQMEELHSVLN